MSALIEKNPYIGIGLYELSEAAVYLGVTSRRVHGWTTGYSYRDSAGSEKRTAPLFARDNPELVDQKLVTFLDLIELYTIAAFRNAKVSLRKIRQAADWAACEFGVSHPFATKEWGTDGFTLWVRHNATAAQEPDAKQLSFDAVVSDLFVNIDYGDLYASRFWPLGKERRVVLDPHFNFGKPIHADSGVPTYSIYEMAQGGTPKSEIAWWFSVPDAAVDAAWEYERSLRQPA